jgi:hypothetical protein
MIFNGLTTKITFLNSVVDETLSITHYTEWDLSSYKDGSLFNSARGCIGHIRAPSFAECVDKAFRLAIGVANVENTV